MIHTKLIWLFIAGGMGTLARYGLAGLVQRFTGSHLPLSTLAVNALGCFLFGIVVSVATERQAISNEMRLLFLVGFMGSFTTFSTFAYETSDLLQDSNWWLAVANVAAQNAIGIGAIFLGMAIARLL